MAGLQQRTNDWQYPTVDELVDACQRFDRVAEQLAQQRARRPRTRRAHAPVRPAQAPLSRPERATRCPEPKPQRRWGLLLRQPRGFEGCGRLSEVAKFGHCPVAERNNTGSRRVDLNAAHAPASALPARDQHVLIKITRPFDLKSPVFPNLAHVSEELEHAVCSHVAHRLANGTDEAHLESSTTHRIEGLWVSPIHRGNATQHDLNVLLRHRPSSIPQEAYTTMTHLPGAPNVAQMARCGAPHAAVATLGRRRTAVATLGRRRGCGPRNGGYV
jgi:hypothetical protein